MCSPHHRRRRHILLLLIIFVALLLSFSSSSSGNYILVDPSGRGNFTTIQAAINAVPSHNTKWTCVHIKQGLYREQVRIPMEKPFIYLKGEGKKNTYVVWDAHDSIATSATFSSEADNTIAKCITFVNSYNSPPNNKRPMKTAVAAMIQGDKSAFYRCGFFGFQDTLWDVAGRHYFKLCSIQGAVDFIFGAGQSLYERCTISVVAGSLPNGVPGYITAQGRSSNKETNGFVFKECKIVGNGNTYLGRAWRDYARVLFYNSSMSEIIVPQGWDSWYNVGREYQLTFAEHSCKGLGSDMARRVKWIKKLSPRYLNHLTSFSFIDDRQGWMRKLPFHI
ncbi:Probable pectinesterase 29 [Striga hermonthica]|uniref:Pectinesterase n=1 Tax=Striga hermonthica TaxID=68872 RepID=A0A9N7N3R1_STRHE|nr:Probable pectinesterase 29 [Striga hermonthica]